MAKTDILAENILHLKWLENKPDGVCADFSREFLVQTDFSSVTKNLNYILNVANLQERRPRLNRGDVVSHFKGGYYEILYPRAKCSTNGKEGYVVIYKPYGSTSDNTIYVRDYDEFMSKVDFKKYPNSEQEYRFEFSFNVDDYSAEKAKKGTDND